MKQLFRTILITFAYGGVLFSHPIQSVAAETNLMTNNSKELKAPIPDGKIDMHFSAFITAKQAQAEALAEKAKRPVPQIVKDYFAAAKSGDWTTATNVEMRISNLFAYPRVGDFYSDLMRVRQPLIEISGAWDQYHDWDAKFLQLYGREIIASIPAKSIYLGGTDPGRFLITAMSESQIKGVPFFTLTQNALADGTYLNYLSNMYGGRIYIATADDSQKCFYDYVEDVKIRLKHDQQHPDEPRQIQPGEEPKIVNDQISISGNVAVMAINARIVKVIFDHNPDREFYIEESFPLDWMYPYLTPHQFIMKLNREPLKEVSTETVKADREFWTHQTDSWFGSWLQANTTVQELTDFVERVYLKKDFTGFKGDKRFVDDEEARKAFSKLRSSIAGIYAWRMTNSKNPAERQSMKAEADFAFRQAFLICPYSPEAIYRYINLLSFDNRLSDAVKIVKTALNLDPGNQQLESLLENLIRSTKK